VDKLVKSFGVGQDREVYGNFKVQSPDGILMFRCDEKKVNWYIKRNLAEFVDDSTIRLIFIPKGLGNHNKEFGLSQMKNHCVVCNTQNYLTRHHVVPFCYRRYFPLELKSHNFHDVLLMCVSCHDSYERRADELKRKVSEKYEAPINGEIIKNNDLVKYSKISTTLLYKDVSSIPKSRIKILKREIKNHFGIKRLTTKRLKSISEIKSSLTTKTHGEIVVGKINDFQVFIEMWRKHFVDNTSAKYLPENWSVKIKIKIDVR
jgi:hypothetical protein